MRSGLDLLGAGEDELIAIEEVVDPLVHLLEGLQVDVVQDHLALPATQLFESFRAALLHDFHDLFQLLLAELAEPLVQSVLLGLWDLFDLGHVISGLIYGCRLLEDVGLVHS